MKKYFLIVKNTWDEVFTYRVNFLMWRVRGVVILVSLYFIWLAVLPDKGTLFGYSRSLMLTYILGTSFLSAIIFSSRSYAIGDEINQGNLSNYLIRPVNYFLYWFAKDVGDKAMNIVLSLIELTLLFFLLRPPFFLQTNPFHLILFLLSLVLAIILYFLLNLLMGFIGFWSAEVWAPRFIFFMISSFLAGGYFPLDVLPKEVSFLFQTLPFGYLLFFPLKIYLGQLPLGEIERGFVISFIWVLLLFVLAKFIWIKGLRIYTAQGR